MLIQMTKQEANLIQVALDHLFEMHNDVIIDSSLVSDNEQVEQSYNIQSMISKIQSEITFKLNNKPINK